MSNNNDQILIRLTHLDYPRDVFLAFHFPKKGFKMAGYFKLIDSHNLSATQHMQSNQTVVLPWINIWGKKKNPKKRKILFTKYQSQENTGSDNP